MATPFSCIQTTLQSQDNFDHKETPDYDGGDLDGDGGNGDDGGDLG